VVELRENLSFERFPTGASRSNLVQIPQDATERQIIELGLLRHRFGDINQAERFRAELASRRRRKPGESILDYI